MVSSARALKKKRAGNDSRLRSLLSDDDIHSLTMTSGARKNLLPDVIAELVNPVVHLSLSVGSPRSIHVRRMSGSGVDSLALLMASPSRMES